MGYIQRRFMQITFSGRQDLFQQNTHHRAETPDHADPDHAEMNNPPWGTPTAHFINQHFAICTF